MGHQFRVALLRLAPDLMSVRLARDFVAEQGKWLPPDAVEDARLLVSELATNALRYGRPDITVQVELDPPLIAVSVHDEGATLPPAEPPTVLPTAPAGRGLNLVDRIASCWGITPTESPKGKAVWLDPAESSESLASTG
jgi:anti-sigma regulatory factor (Ser/Thr protein kinase)